jgi:hypothetical protein
MVGLRLPGGRTANALADRAVVVRIDAAAFPENLLEVERISVPPAAEAH